MPARVVQTPEGERVAVKTGGAWRWWTAQDRIRPRGKIIGMGEDCEFAARMKAATEFLDGLHKDEEARDG